MPSLEFRRVLRSEEHTSELQSHSHLVCRLLLEKKQVLSLALPPLLSTSTLSDSLTNLCPPRLISSSPLTDSMNNLIPRLANATSFFLKETGTAGHHPFSLRAPLRI